MMILKNPFKKFLEILLILKHYLLFRNNAYCKSRLVSEKNPPGMLSADAGPELLISHGLGHLPIALANGMLH